MPTVRIGTSGWAYKDWRGPFYPPEIRDSDRLEYISGRFATLEINASFYRLPTEAAVAVWRDETPEDFRFAWKASRYLTHNKKLKDPADSLELMFSRTRLLGDKLGPVLFQLPPNLRRNDERLATFLGALPDTGRFVMEFRHTDWFDESVFKRLRDHNIALCISDHHDAPSPSVVTADFVYWRGHGPGGRYEGRYPAEDLNTLAHTIEDWSGSRDVYAYFDNDIRSAAPADAIALIERLGF